MGQSELHFPTCYLNAENWPIGLPKYWILFRHFFTNNNSSEIVTQNALSVSFHMGQVTMVNSQVNFKPLGDIWTYEFQSLIHNPLQTPLSESSTMTKSQCFQLIQQHQSYCRANLQPHDNNHCDSSRQHSTFNSYSSDINFILKVQDSLVPFIL